MCCFGTISLAYCFIDTVCFSSLRSYSILLIGVQPCPNMSHGCVGYVTTESESTRICLSKLNKGHETDHFPPQFWLGHLIPIYIYTHNIVGAFNPSSQNIGQSPQAGESKKNKCFKPPPPHVLIYLGVCKNRGTPKWMVKIMENPIKHGMIWGVLPPVFLVDTHFIIFLGGWGDSMAGPHISLR